MKTYFLTGGDGFIGFHVAKEILKDEDNKVVIYDAHKHYIPLEESSWFKYQQYRIKELKKYGERVVRMRGDVTDKELLKQSLRKYNPEIIIHLAALPIAKVCDDYPDEARINIFESTISILEAIRNLNLNLDKFIYTSSSMVYGDFLRDNENNIIPAKENQQCNPIGIYGAMKLAGEHLVKVYSKRFNLPYSIIRPSAVYGPTDCNRRVTEIFLTNALKGKELVLDNGGLHKLDFSYIKDVAKGFVLVANSKKALNETFNITFGEGRTIKELAETIKKLIPNTKIIEKTRDVYRPNRGTLDISKAKNLLGYKPEYNLEKGMEEYLDFVKNNNLS